MKIWVSGGRGFIGAAVCRELENREIEYVSFDRSEDEDYDVRDFSYVVRSMAGCTHSIHLAGVLGTSELFDAPWEAVEVNVIGSLNVIKSCIAHNASYTSITMPSIWKNLYQATKRCARDIASAYHLRGLPVSHVKAFNVFGEGQRVGPHHPQKLVPTHAYNAWNGHPLPVWGDGSQYVDLIHVRDVARMLVDATQFGDDEVFEAGTGHPLTVLDVAHKVLGITNSPSEIEFLEMREGEQRSDPPIALGLGWDKLGWSPTYDEEDLRSTVLSYLPVTI